MERVKKVLLQPVILLGLTVGAAGWLIAMAALAFLVIAVPFVVVGWLITR